MTLILAWADGPQVTSVTHLHGVDAALGNGSRQRTSYESLMNPQHLLVSAN